MEALSSGRRELFLIYFGLNVSRLSVRIHSVGCNLPLVLERSLACPPVPLQLNAPPTLLPLVSFVTNCLLAKEGRAPIDIKASQVFPQSPPFLLSLLHHLDHCSLCLNAPSPHPPPQSALPFVSFSSSLHRSHPSLHRSHPTRTLAHHHAQSRSFLHTRTLAPPAFQPSDFQQ